MFKGSEKMRKGMSGLWVLAIIGAVAVFAAYGGMFSSVPSSNFNGCTWAPDYGWVQCCADTSASGTYQVVVQPFVTFTCPTSTTVHQCSVINAPTGNYPCFAPTLSTGSIFGRGTTFTAGSCQAATVQVEGQILIRSGLAGSCQGSQASGAQGCSWQPPAGAAWADGTTGVKSIPFGSGNSQQYVISQHLLSCPSTCTNPMACSTPSNLASFTVTYSDGQQHPAYKNCVGSSCTIQVIGCKPSGQICTNISADGNTCTGYGASSQCGIIGTQSGGQCAQSSDCGAVGTYTCQVDPNTHFGTCVPLNNNQQCTYDYDCTQTGQTCQNRQLSGVSCVNHQCVNSPKTVQCCVQSDCSTGFFCNTNPSVGGVNTCVKAQNELSDCIFGCCDSTKNANDVLYKQKPCSGGQYCCGDHTCQANAAACAPSIGGGGGTGACPPIFGVIPDIPCLIGQWWNQVGIYVIIIVILLVIAGLFIILK